MRVVYIIDSIVGGGAPKSLIEMVCELKRLYNVDPVVLTSQNNGFNKTLDKYGIENYAVGHGSFMVGSPEKKWKKPFKWLILYMEYHLKHRSSIEKSLKLIDWEKVDLIHSNSVRTDLGIELARITKKRCICHVREFAELDYNCWSYKASYIDYLNRGVDGFIAVSDSVKNYWISKGLTKEKIEVVYNGVDNRQIQRVDHSNWEEEKCLKLVIVGEVIKNKGQLQAALAISLLPESIRKNIILSVIGTVSTKNERRLREVFLMAGIPENIRVLGMRNDVYECLKNYHIGLMCSKAEAFGRVTAEYMHAGLAVIASNTGANPVLVKDNETGLIYDKNKTEDLSNKIERLFYDRRLMISIAQKGHDVAKKKYTCTINAERVYECYRYVNKWSERNI